MCFAFWSSWLLLSWCCEVQKVMSQSYIQGIQGKLIGWSSYNSFLFVCCVDFFLRSLGSKENLDHRKLGTEAEIQEIYILKLIVTSDYIFQQ